MPSSDFQRLLAVSHTVDEFILATDGVRVVFANHAAKEAADAPLDGVRIDALFGEPVCDTLRDAAAREMRISLQNCLFFDLPCSLDMFPGEPALIVLRPRRTPVFPAALPFTLQSVAAISGEFRAPLTSLFTSVDLLRARVDEADEKSRDYLSVVTQNCYRLLRLSNNLVDLSRFTANKGDYAPKNQDLAAFCLGVCRAAEPYARAAGIPLNFETSVSTLVAAFDREKLERLLLNLISNAIKYTRAGNVVTVRLALLGENALIHVVDQGAGIGDDALPFAFSAYRLGERPGGGGYGVGLAIVHAIATMHGGTVMLETREGFGTTVVVSIPIKTVPGDLTLHQASAYDYAGGFNHTLLELSDALDAAQYRAATRAL